MARKYWEKGGLQGGGGGWQMAGGRRRATGLGTQPGHGAGCREQGAGAWQEHGGAERELT